MKSKKFPSVPEDLLKALEETFPNVLPPKGCTIEDVRVKQGNQEVLEFLRTAFERQNKTILEKT